MPSVYEQYRGSNPEMFKSIDVAEIFDGIEGLCERYDQTWFEHVATAIGTLGSTPELADYLDRLKEIQPQLAKAETTGKRLQLQKLAAAETIDDMVKEIDIRGDLQ